MGRRAVFLDRDGVINSYHHNADFGTIDAPATPEQFTLLPRVADAIAELNRRDFAVIVTSNQPGIAKGKFSPRLLQAITLKMVKQLADSGARLDDVLYCTHHPRAMLPEHRFDCGCRKPKPGMMLIAARERGLDLADSFLVGDGVDDMLAGLAAGVTTILLGPRRCSICEEFAAHGAQPDRIARDLSEAVQTIVALAARRSHFPTIRYTANSCLIANRGSLQNCDQPPNVNIPDTPRASAIEHTVELAHTVRRGPSH